MEHYHEGSPDYIGLDSTAIDEERIWCQGQHKFSARGEFMPREHVFYYSPRSLEYLLRKSGFKMLKHGPVP
jgi:hypothetical protein